MRKNLVLSKHSMGTLILQRDLILIIFARQFVIVVMTEHPEKGAASQRTFSNYYLQQPSIDRASDVSASTG